MIFTRGSRYHQVSECRQYTVCWVSGKYEAWHLQEQMAVNLETAEEAREVCCAHREKISREHYRHQALLPLQVSQATQ